MSSYLRDTTLDYEILEARALQKLEKAKEAKEKYESLCKRYPDDPRAFLYLAGFYLNNENFERNEQLLKQAESIDSSHWLLALEKLIREYRLGNQVDVAKIVFDPKSRDDIPKILCGLQAIYTNTALRTSIFELLKAKVSPNTSKTNGRPGMTLWSILVCGVIRLDLNCDYDRLHELVNHHNTLRQMLGHDAFDDVTYHFQTLKDNVGLLTTELLDEIHQLVVRFGHTLVKKKDDEALRGRCDSFVP